MPRIETIKIERDGRSWNGSFTVEDGEVSVASAYGSERRRIGRRKPALVAQEALAEIMARSAR